MSNKPLFDNLNTELVRYSDPHCNNNKLSRGPVFRSHCIEQKIIKRLLKCYQVVSISALLVLFYAFSYNGVYPLRLILNRMLNQFHSAGSFLKRW